MKILLQVSKQNVTRSLQEREYTSGSCYRRNLSIMRNIICDEKAKFVQVSEHHSKHPITYEGGKLFFDKNRHCMVSHGPNGQPASLFKLPACPRGHQIEDALYGHCNSLESLRHGRRSCRNSLYCLTAHNVLQRYDAEYGHLLEEIYLSAKYKFKHLSWSSQDHSILLKSTHHHSTRLSVAEDTIRTTQNVFMALCLIGVFPTTFSGAIEIDRRVFGKNVCDAMISHNGLLIVMCLTGWVRMYNWELIVSQNKLFNAELFKECSELNGTVGTKPCGLPINIRLQECPPVLFEVRCADHDLQMGGIPWHYVTCPFRQNGIRHVAAVSSGRLAENGVVDLSTMTVEPEKLLFHDDDSGKLLHISATSVRMLKILQGSTGLSELKELYVINADDTRRCPNDQINAGWTLSSSGRIVKRRTTQDLADCSYQTLQNVDYENELDLLSVVMVTEDADCWSAKVNIHDNQTGIRKLEIPLEESWNEFWDHHVSLDMDTLIHIVKAPVSKFSCYLYRLDRRLTNETLPSGVQKSRKKNRIPRRTVR